jgi:hypothetical protein
LSGYPNLREDKMSKKYYIKPGRAVLTMKRKSVGFPGVVTEKDFKRGEEAIKDLLASKKCPIQESKPDGHDEELKKDKSGALPPDAETPKSDSKDSGAQKK